jgi:hypothetical protein
MKRFLFQFGFVAVAIFCAGLQWSSTRPVDAANGLAGQVKGPQKKAIPPNRILAGEVEIEVNCPGGQHRWGEVSFPRELPKVPLIFLMENRQTGAFVVFKADEVTTKGFKWAGFKLFGDESYKTNLAWLAVLPD